MNIEIIKLYPFLIIIISLSLSLSLSLTHTHTHTHTHTLFQVGFFRRKKKPEEGEIEGDFDPDKFKLKPEGGVEPQTTATGEEPSAPKVEEITKV